MWYYWKSYSQSISNYFVFQILILIKTFGFTQSTENSILTKACGTLTINSLSPQVSVSLEEGLKIPHSLFLNITEKLVNASLVVNPGCRVDVCGFSANTGTADDNGGCNTFWRSVTKLPIVPYNHLYAMTSLSCACDKKRAGCESSVCTHDLLMYDDCSVLYQEINCQNCYYNSIRLKDEYAFRTDDSGAIRSIVVRSDCWITLKTKGTLWIDASYDKVYKDNRNYLNPSFHAGLGGEEFFCFCSPRALNRTTHATAGEIESSTKEPAIINSTVVEETTVSVAVSNGKSGDSDGGLIVIAGSLIAVLVVIGLGVLVFYRYRKSNGRHQNIPGGSPMLSDDIIRQFKTGAVVNQYEDGVEILSQGHSKALVLPYDAKFEISRTRFIIDVRNILGQGNFGIVYKGKLKVSEDPTNFEYIDVAIKTVKPFATAEYIKPLLNEIKVISYIGHHPNIVCFLGACTWNLRNGDIFNLMEFCGKGSLKEHLENIKPVQQIHIVLEVNDLGYSKCDIDAETQGNGIAPTRISDDLYQLLLKWSGEIAAGMHYLSCKNVVHIDLAGRNIFLTNDLVAKIGDFGLSRKLYSVNEYDKKGSDAVPVGWIALECMRENKYSTKSDVWAYGVVLYEIFSFGADPYDEKSGREIFAMLNSGNRLPCPAFATPEIYAQMMDCWKEDPKSRPTFRELEEFFTTHFDGNTDL